MRATHVAQEQCRDAVRKRCGRSSIWSGLVAALVGVAGAHTLGAAVSGTAALIRALGWCGPLTRPPKTPASHRTSRALQLLKPNKATALVLHAICGLLAAINCLSILGCNFTVTCKYSNSVCLVESSLLILVAGSINGFYYYLRTFIFDDPCLQFPLVEQRKFVRIKLALVPTLKRAAYDAFAPMILTALAYYWKGYAVRGSALYLLGAHLEEKPLDGLFSTFSFTILFQMWCNSAVFLFTVYAAMLFFELYLTESLRFPIEPRENGSTLSEELTGDLEILNELAARDLMRLAYDDEARRKQIFSLSIPGGHPTNWKNLLKECLKIVDSYANDIEKITYNSKPAEETKSSAAHHSITSPQRLSMRNLVNPAMINPDRFDESITPSKPIGDTLRDEFNNFIAYLCKKPVINFFFDELTDLKIKRIAHRGRAVAKVCQGLAQLTSASIGEDSYGVVQDDLPIIITSLLQLKLALDRLTKFGIVNRRNLRQDSAPVRALTELKSAVKRSVYKITTSFGDYVGNIALDGDIQLMLKPFIYFREG